MKVLHWLNEHFEKTICIILFVLFSAVMMLNVIMRYVFANSLPWTTEFVLFVFIWFIMFAMSYGFRSGAHVRVDIALRFLPDRAKTAMLLLGNLMVLGLFIYLFYFGITLVINGFLSGMRGQLFPYPVWTLNLALPVGTFCSIIRITQNLLITYRELKG